MKTYNLTLNGTKKNNTQTITVEIFGVNKSQAFNMAYTFFEKGEINNIFGGKETGLSTIHQWIPQAANLISLAGKYKVQMTKLKCN